MGMTSDVIKNFFKKPFTLDFPKKKSKVSVNFRGKIYVDNNVCIACKLCETYCPTGAIVVRGKRAVVDEGLCIYCSLCAEVCPVKCIYFKNEYETAVRKTKNLKQK